jgi:hypothetical protein
MYYRWIYTRISEANGHHATQQQSSIKPKAAGSQNRSLSLSLCVPRPVGRFRRGRRGFEASWTLARQCIAHSFSIEQCRCRPTVHLHGMCNLAAAWLRRREGSSVFRVPGCFPCFPVAPLLAFCVALKRSQWVGRRTAPPVVRNWHAYEPVAPRGLQRPRCEAGLCLVGAHLGSSCARTCPTLHVAQRDWRRCGRQCEQREWPSPIRRAHPSAAAAKWQQQ